MAIATNQTNTQGRHSTTAAASEASEIRRPDRSQNAPYVSPRLECLGEWRALTLQQSSPGIG